VWSYGSCEFKSLRRNLIDTKICDKICQWLAAGRWFSPVSSNNKTDLHYITEILLKVALNTITPNPNNKYTNQLYCRLWHCWRKPEKTSDLPQVTDKFYHIFLYRLNFAWGIWTHNYHTITTMTTPLFIVRNRFVKLKFCYIIQCINRLIMVHK
jgi:hypothetical protein